MSLLTTCMITTLLVACCHSQNDSAASSTVAVQDVNEKTPDKEQVTNPSATWDKKPGDTVAGINQTVWLHCVIKSNLKVAPTYQWFNENGEEIQSVSLDANNTSELDIWSFVNGTLVITSLSDDYAGEYTCKSSLGLEQTASVSLGQPVVLGDFLDTVETYLGCNVTVVCRAIGDGEIEGSWMHGGKELVLQGEQNRKFYTSSVVNDTSHFVLHIMQTTADDNGTYACEATNDYNPSASKSINVVLTERPENTTCPETVIIASAPQVDNPDETSTVENEEQNFMLVYVLPAVIVGTLLLIAIIIAILLIARKRRQQQNAVFSGVKYRRTEGNEESIRA